MQWKKPKNTSKYQWTQHVVEKMHFYGLSEQKVLGVIRRPQRIETCVVENTVAVMVPVGNISKGKQKSKWGAPVFAPKEVSPKKLSSSEESWNQEIWVMYQVDSQHSIYRKRQECDEHFSKDEDLSDDEKKLQLQYEKFGTSEKAQKLMNLVPKKITIISAWRYPGVSSKNNPIPEEILRELEEIGI